MTPSGSIERPVERAGAVRRGGLVRLGVSACVLPVLLAGTPAAGESLEEVLAQAYRTNPELMAARAELRARDERVEQGYSAGRPKVSLRGSLGLKHERYDYEAVAQPGQDESRSSLPGDLSLAVTQHLYQGGRIFRGIEMRDFEVLAARQRLATVEQDVLLAAATSFADVFRDRAVVELTKNNEKVLARQFEATKDRFSVGEVTQTDVAQAAARLASVKAERIRAEGALEISRAGYEQVVGAPAGKPANPGKMTGLPANFRESLDLAGENHPTVLRAGYDLKVALKEVDLIRTEKNPLVTLEGELAGEVNDSQAVDSRLAASVTLNLTVPLYQQGLVASRIREAMEEASRRRMLLEQARRKALETARSAWEELQSARARIEALTVAEKSSTLALEGVKQEAGVGSRTVLDVLDAEQELLDVQVNLVRARRDELVASVTLLQAVGGLSAAGRNLPVDVYDVEEHYKGMRGRSWP